MNLKIRDTEFKALNITSFIKRTLGSGIFNYNSYMHFLSQSIFSSLVAMTILPAALGSVENLNKIRTDGIRIVTI